MNTPKATPHISPYVFAGLVKPGIQVKTMLEYLTPADVINRICAHRGITLQDIKSQTRAANISYTRFIIYYFLLKNIPGVTVSNAGKYFGSEYDHASIIHGRDRVKSDMQIYPDTKKMIETLQREFEMLNEHRIAEFKGNAKQAVSFYGNQCAAS